MQEVLHNFKLFFFPDSFREAIAYSVLKFVLVLTHNILLDPNKCTFHYPVT